ncbi:MAG TPA: metallophosphoesterase [Tepidisphaeraceae bacterium]|nr:metallophosphoesterase [Tepidisphaeraceae bacterium]
MPSRDIITRELLSPNIEAMRLIVTADLHYNHAKSRSSADDVIDQINRAGGDALLVVGDTGVGDGDGIEQCLSKFTIRGPRLFVSGNHELWTSSGNSLELFHSTLPNRVRQIGWHWLEDAPFLVNDAAIVGSIGWYDYSFAVPELEIARRFYEAKISPGAVNRLPEFGNLILGEETDASLAIVGRWNDGKYVSLRQSDEAFLAGRIPSLRAQLSQLAKLPQILAAVHHVPFEALLPPRRGAQWDFARAYLGSGAMGDMIVGFENVQTVLCGHSHWPMEVTIGRARAINIGSGYRAKRFVSLDL